MHHPEPVEVMTAARLLSTLSDLGVELSLDGDRLRAAASPGVITPELQAAIRRLKPELVAMLAGGTVEPAASQESTEAVRLSPAQELLWLFQQLDPESTTYNLTPVIRIEGTLDRARLESALRQVVERHYPLHSVVEDAPGGATIRPVEVPADLVAYHDLSSLSGDEQVEAARVHRSRDQNRAFDLRTEVPIRATLLRLRSDLHELSTTIHHIAVDGVSLQHFYNDLATLYDGRPPEPLRATYLDFAAEQRRYWTRERLAERAEFWRRQLDGAPRVLELPSDSPRAASQSFTGAFVMRKLEQDTLDAVQTLARTERASVFMVVLAAFSAALHRHTGQRDMIIGTPLHGRERSEHGNIVGMFVNQLPLRMNISRDATARGLVRHARDVALASMTDHEMPFGALVEALKIPRDNSRSPLFQAMVNVLPGGSAANGIPAAGVVFRMPEPHEMLALFDGQSKFDATLYVLQLGGSMHLILVYNRDLYSAERMTAVLDTVHTALSACATPDQDLTSQLVRTPPPTPWAERLRTAGTRLAAQSVPERFMQVAEQNPAAAAIITDSGTVTYAELRHQAERVARVIREAGANGSIDSPVGLLVPHGSSSIPALLGALMSGRPYVPLDADYPAERLSYMVEDAGIRTVLTVPQLRERAATLAVGAVVITTEDEPADSDAPLPLPQPESVAYLLYTSGSTGRPKAVVQTHGRLLQQAGRYADAISLRGGDRLAWLASISFDASLMDVFGGLSGGAAICPIDPRKIDLATLPRFITEHHLNVLHFTPTVFRTMARADNARAFAGVRAVVLGGEPVRPRDIEFFDQHFPADALLFNLYGASEHSFSLGYAVDRKSRSAEIPIGWPLGDVEVVLLDEQRREDPVRGELAIRSRHGAIGYWNRPELTADTFIPDPAIPGATLYRSGDIVRRRPDGAYVFQHRADNQMKVRGNRVEAYEVESVLLAHAAIAEAAVHSPAEANGEAALCACVVMRPGVAAPQYSELAAWCSQRLPGYMVPSAWVTLERLPRTPSGKIDRRNLPEPSDAGGQGAAHTQAGDAVEAEIQDIWREVLGRDNIGTSDDFFVVGGHSLTATQVVSRIRDVLDVELPLRYFFDHPTVSDTAAWVRANRGERAGMPALVRTDHGAQPPLSFSQERLWFLQQLDRTASAYNMAAAMLIEGPLDVERMRMAIDTVAMHQEGMRTHFEENGGRPFQYVADTPVHQFTLHDMSGLPASERLDAALSLVRQTLDAPYDLSRDPLCRILIVKLDAERHVFGIGMHHTISDMWSYSVLGNQIRAVYEGEQLPPLPIDYRHYAIWQREWLTGAVLEQQLDYWRKQLVGVPVLELATDFPRPQFMKFDGDAVRVDLTHELRERIRTFSVSNRVTPFMTMLAAFNVLMAARSLQDDIAVGVPIAGRGMSETQNLVGTFVNTLVHRNHVPADRTFAELVNGVRVSALDAYSHQDVPFELLVRDLNQSRDPSRPPLAQVLFNVANVRATGYGISGMQHTILDLGRRAAQFDITMHVGLNEAQSEIQVTYNTSLFSRATAESMLEQYMEILGTGVAQPSTRVADLKRAGSADRRRLLEDWNETERPRSARTSVLTLFSDAAARTPDRKAVASPTGSFTYAELLEYAGQVTAALQTMGVGTGDRVAIVMQRSREMMGALLGILGTGAAYVPVDPNYPPARVQYMLEDANAAAVVTHRGLEEPYNLAVPVLDLDKWTPLSPAPFASVTEDQPAYVIYTSGSTGKPKGVEIPHGAMANFLLSMQQSPGLAAGDTLLAVTTISFDIAVLELFLPLISGARVVIAGEDEALDGRRLIQRMEQEGVTVMQATPATWKLLLASGWKGSPEMKLLCGGEPLPRRLADDLLDRSGELWNMYGPTETTVWSSLDRVERDAPVLVGRPIANTTMYVLGENLELRPVGVPGELYIGGAGVARGYVNRPDLTAERFIESPFRDGERLYRTGDLVRYRHDGRIEHLGRLDNQVKVRGFRIELGEVETALQSHPAVRDAVVVASDDRLVGYIVLEESANATGTELRGWVGGTLPPYMVPSFIVPLDALPLTPNGKVDRKQLPDPTGHQGEPTEWTPPEDPAAVAIAEVWSALLGIERIGEGDNFFELGGHSLLAMEAVAMIEERTGHRPEPRSLFFMSLGELAGTLPITNSTV